MIKLIFSLGLISSLLNAQNEKNAASVVLKSNSNFLKLFYPWLDNYTGTKKLKEISFKEVIKGKDFTSFILNEKGQPVREEFDFYYDNSLRKNNSKVLEYTYDKSDNVTEVKHFDKKHKLTYSQSWSYYSPNQLSSTQRALRGRPYEQTFYSYNEDSTLAKNETYSIKNGTESLQAVYLYAYYDDKKLRTTKFYKKNKLKHTWSYACDERGNIAKKDTTNICTSEGVDSRGRKIVTRFSSDKPGNITKTVSYYLVVNGNDQLSECQTYRVRKNKEVMTLAIHEPDSLEPFKSVRTFKDNGAVVYEDLVTYAVYTHAAKVLSAKNTRFFNNKNKITYQRLETFKKGIPEICVEKGRHDREYVKLEYVFAGDKEFVINHYRKSKLKKSYKATVSYY